MKFLETPKNGNYYVLNSEKLTFMYFSINNYKRPSNFIKDLDMGCRYIRYHVEHVHSWPLYITDVNKFMLGLLKYEL